MFSKPQKLSLQDSFPYFFFLIALQRQKITTISNLIQAHRIVFNSIHQYLIHPKRLWDVSIFT